MQYIEVLLRQLYNILSNVILTARFCFSRSKFMAKTEFMGRACKNCDVGKTGLKPFGGLNRNRAQIVMIILQIKPTLWRVGRDTMEKKVKVSSKSVFNAA